MRGVKGVATRAPQRALFRYFDGKGWSATGKNAGPRAKNFGLLHDFSGQAESKLSGYHERYSGPMQSIVTRLGGSDLKRNAVGGSGPILYGVGSISRVQALSKNSRQRARPGVPCNRTPPCKQQIDELPALPGKHQHQGQSGEEHESGQFKILAAVQKVIPCPEMLCKRRGDE